MTKAFIWFVLAYAALKFAGMATARGAGFRSAPVTLRDRMTAGEPALIVIALLIAVPGAMLTSWYAHRHLSGIFAHSVDCYGEIMAVKDAPVIAHGDMAHAAYEHGQGYRNMAYVVGAQLAMSPAAVTAALSRQTMLAKRRHPSGGSPGREARLCLDPPADAPNA